MAIDPNQIGAPSTAESTALTNSITNQIETGTYGQQAGTTPSPNPTAAATTIRNISQTTQEREIIKTAPDTVVFIDGLPYLTNPFLNDPRTGAKYTLVNFNDNITSVSASYDTESLVPNCSIQLQIPNYEKYLYQMPGGNNLFQTMAQVQIYAKSYFMAATGDTVYRRIFKGVTSYIGYNDNGKTLEVTIQCHGILHLLEKMQINLHPSTVSSHLTGARQTVYQSILASGDPFQVIAALFLEPFRSDGFQVASIQSSSLVQGQGNTSMYYDAIQRGYMAKWQAILYNMVKDVHIYGPNKDNLGIQVIMKRDGTWGKPDKATLAASIKKRSTMTETQTVDAYDTYYENIQDYQPYAIITQLDFSNSMIVNRLDAIREVVRRINFEAYQDVDGKVIIKPPLYNLDVVNLGSRLKQTSTALNSSQNSYTNPATAIYENNNPFVIHLSEILTEQESEDQSAIRRTRTTVSGNASKHLAIQHWREDIKEVGEYIDVTKLAKFGLREEPMYNVPWIGIGSKLTLFAHAVAETVRANRGYRTYTITIPMRPELKLGFPVFIPHKDMYAYIKSISLNYSIGGTATMTLTCDSVRKRIMVNTDQTLGSGNSSLPQSLYTSAPNLVVQWTKNPPTPTSTDPSQSPSNAAFWQNQAYLLSQGKNGGVSGSNANKGTNTPVGSSQTLPQTSTNPDGSKTAPTPQQLKVQSHREQKIGNSSGNMTDTPYATYVVKNDANSNQGTIDPNTSKGYFSYQRKVDLSYLQALTGNPKTGAPSTIPYTDEKGYEVLAPFPWGRWQTLNSAIKQFTEQGWITQPTDVNGDPTDDLEDEATFNNAQAFLFAGLGTPTTSNDPSTQLTGAINTQISAVGGSNIATQAPQSGATNPSTGQSTNNTSPGVDYAQQKSVSQQDATVIILHYSPSSPGTFAANQLLSQSQPENQFATAALQGTQSFTQQLVDVLVSGKVAPIPAVQEQLLATRTQLPNGTITLISHPLPSGR